MAEDGTSAAKRRARITYRLPDGQRREMYVSADELAELEQAGRAIPRFERVMPRVVQGLFVLLLTAIVVPAITGQWSSRPEELQLKTDIVQRLSESSAVAVSNARFLGSPALPEHHASTQVCDDPEQLLIPGGLERCAVARRDEALASARVNFETRTEWRKAAASLTARVATYFPDDAKKWRGYGRAVERFLQLPTAGCDDKRTKRLLRYIDAEVPKRGVPDHWAPLFRLSDRECRDPAARSRRHNYSRRVDELSNRLLAEGQTLLDDVRTGNADGFSTTTEDFLGDVWWVIPLLVLLGAVLLAESVWWRLAARRDRRRRARDAAAGS